MICKVCGKETKVNEHETCENCHKKIMERIEQKKEFKDDTKIDNYEKGNIEEHNYDKNNDEYPNNLFNKILIAIFIIAGIVAIINCFIEEENRSSKSDTKSYDDKKSSYSSDYSSSYSSNYDSSERDLDAWICAKDAVEQHLWRYSKIKVSSYSDSKVKYSSSTDIYTITGTVSYVNSYNATVNAYYYVELELTADGYKNAYTYVY